jgi:spore coat polysaccharide biosynthesis predicted glycosyltransferase SpsG
MAQLMADSDLAIGAAGATAWERCCLGLPTLMLVLADNQHYLAEVLVGAGAAKLLDLEELNNSELISSLGMGLTASTLVDGEGVARVLQALRGLCD